MTGKGRTTWKTVSEFKDDNTQLFKMYVKGPDGNDMLCMEVNYTRRKQ
jgi:hypothetical protein